MIDPASVLGSLANLSSVLGAFDGLLKGARGTKRSLLLELEANLRLAQIGKQGNISAEKLIQRLQTKALQNAIADDNFKFSSLKSGKVKKQLVGDAPQLQRYVGWTTEKLFLNIYLKIGDLQHIVELAPDADHFRVNVRLGNVFRLMLLLARHIRS